MSESKRQALDALNRLHQENRIDYGDYSVIYDALAEMEPLRDRDDELEELWAQFGDVPMSPETECIEAPFLGWGAGIHREEIWHWFDTRHSKGVAYLLNGVNERMESEDSGPVNSPARACGICLNASVDPELTDENDLSFHTVGESDNGFRIMVQSGWGKPTQLLFERWVEGQWHLAGVYEPNYCPNCGRDLTAERAGKKPADAAKKLWGRCGVTFWLTGAEYDAASSGGADAQALIQKKIRQGAFTLDGESYFPSTHHSCSDEWPVSKAVTLEF